MRRHGFKITAELCIRQYTSPFHTLPHVHPPHTLHQQLLVALSAACIHQFGHWLKRKSACSPKSAGVHQIGIAACPLALLGCFRWSRQVGTRVSGGASRPAGWQSATTVLLGVLSDQGVVLSELHVPACERVRSLLRKPLTNKY